jgi:myo-inositol-1(or 4)-monophosphatase
MQNEKFNEFTKAAIAAAEIGGEILSGYFVSKIEIGYKGRIDPVTPADRASQRAVIRYLKKYFPAHSFIGEENIRNYANSEYCWVIDPLDGTVNYIHSVPQYCISIGLLRMGKAVSGVIYSPCLNELFVAQKGIGAYLNGKRIRVSSIRKLVRSLVVTGFPYEIGSDEQNVMKSFSNVIMSVQGVRRLGSAALDLAYVAAGRFESFWEKGLQSWDVAAGSLMVDEAGGKITEYCGGDNYIFGKTLLATNGLVHRSMIKLINKPRTFGG